MIKKFKLKAVNNLKALLSNRSQITDHNETIENLRNTLKQKTQELENLKPEYYWFKWYYSEYAATLRMLQYKQATLDINNKLINHHREFIDIEDVIQKIIAPPPSNGALTKEYIYFAARNVFLPDECSNEINLYSMSYLGNAEFAHSKQAFDAFINYPSLSSSNELIQLDKNAGLLSEFIQNDKIGDLEYAYTGEYKHFRPFSYNTGDLDKDGKHDFMLGRKLLLSSNNYDMDKSLDLPQESIFLKTHDETLLISLDNNYLIINRYLDDELQQVSKTPIQTNVYKNIPHVLYPLPLNKDQPVIFAIRSERGLDIYELNDSMTPELRWWITGLAEKEVLIGAFGNFINNDFIDFWVSQVATGIERKACADQVILISSQQLLNSHQGEVLLNDVSYFTVKGSEKYSDYDGISTSLSPIAGDIDADGKPDLSFVGHRHMNEAGALYILLNDDIKKGGVIDITNKKIIKVLGKPMSQLAPPYIHWDATDLTGSGHCDIIVSADNDLYSGLHAGAIYILDSKKILHAWREKCKS
ncbi:TPA: hypothetical protein JBI01_09430 [Legionella pneumophila]|nr:hypothetical protein [Legionella pneumophila]HAU1225895.1 hypothetical protein [Legionella pneumophila]